MRHNQGCIGRLKYMDFPFLVMLASTLYAVVVPVPAAAAQHTVGRSAGWTIPAVGNVNYSTWAAGFTFHVGDVLVFKYDPTLHDVLQVSEDDYNMCNASTPEAKYNTGITLVTLDKAQTWFFMCGVPGHCFAGQKVQVQVSPMPPLMAPSPIEHSYSPLFAPLPSSAFISPSPSLPHISNSTPPLSSSGIAPFSSQSSPLKSHSTPHPSSWASPCSCKQTLLITLVFATWLTYGYSL